MPTVHPSHANGKKCPKCNEFKPASAFAIKSSKYGYLKSWCNACLNAQSLARYHANPVAHNLRCIAWAKVNAEKAREIRKRSDAKCASKINQREREYRRRVRTTEEFKLKKKKWSADDRRRRADQIAAYNAKYYRENKEAVTVRIKKCIAAKPELYNQLRKAVKHRRKVRLTNSGPTEKFTDLEIFNRDNWVCQLCGAKVDRSLKYPNPKSASLDHVVPIAKGGGHTRANSQLAHLGCNSSKRDRTTVLF